MNDSLGWNPTRRRSQRKKIKDTTALSLFVQETVVDRPPRVRRGSTRGAPVRMGRQRSRAHPNAEAALADIEGAKLPLAAMNTDGVQNPANVAQLLNPPASEILDGGGLRLMRSMSVFLTQDERIILADPSSGMAALVTGVAQVSDAELATIAGAFFCSVLVVFTSCRTITDRKYICLLAAAQKACLPAPDAAAQPSGGLDTGLLETSGARTARTRKPEDAQAETVKSDADNPSEHGGNGLAGALAGLLALKSGEVRNVFTLTQLHAHPAQFVPNQLFNTLSAAGPQ